MLNFGDALYEAEIRAQQANPVPRSLARRWSLAATLREGMARLGDLLITVGCELEVRYLAAGHSSACAG
jgi:hypothetical protein